MNGEDHSSWQMAPPPMAPLNMEREEHWRRFDNSVNAVSFGFVATAILISMFLVMAIFERFLRPRSSMPPGPTSASDLEAQMMFNGKLNYPSPKVCFLSLSLTMKIEITFSLFAFCLWWQQLQAPKFCFHFYNITFYIIGRCNEYTSTWLWLFIYFLFMCHYS